MKITKNSKPGRLLRSLQVLVLALLLLAFFFVHRSTIPSASSATTISSNTQVTTEKAQARTMGYTKTVIKEGNGQRPEKGMYVTVHCTGYGKNRDMSQKFWSTKDPGQQPFTFRVGMGEVGIHCWRQFKTNETCSYIIYIFR